MSASDLAARTHNRKFTPRPRQTEQHTLLQDWQAAPVTWKLNWGPFPRFSCWHGFILGHEDQMYVSVECVYVCVIPTTKKTTNKSLCVCLNPHTGSTSSIVTHVLLTTGLKCSSLCLRESAQTDQDPYQDPDPGPEGTANPLCGL